MGKSDQIIIFAGVFDPVHNGHIETARKALESYGSLVVFMPERMPWHKHGSTPYVHRLAMLEAATADEPNMVVVDYPAERMRIKETFLWLMGMFPNSSFVWMVGSDVAPYMSSWDDFGLLHELGVRQILIAKRNNDVITSSLGIPKDIEMQTIQSPLPHCSSTMIRAGKLRMADTLHPEVERYCKAENLYASS